MINRVFLDIDGVLANFTKACCEKIEAPYPTNFAFPETWLDEVASEKIWSRCRGYDYWVGLEVYPWSNLLRTTIDKTGKEWVYLTKPSQDGGCYAGKYDWVTKHFKDASKRLWLANGVKSLVCRGSSDLLIDDKLKNGRDWQAAGGTFYHWEEITPDYSTDKVLERIKEIQRIITSP
jgi:hypothetical protein